MEGSMNNIYAQYLKRFFDIIIALVAILVLSPVFLIVGLLVKIKLGSPVFFKQPRPGKNEKIFNMYKFRTMSDKRDDSGELLPDEVRLGKFGSFLRESSLDELPELFCVLIGKMSIVGPRPQLVRDMVFMDARQRKRHDVLPGITGLAQVNGRNAIRWEDKLEYDLKYVENISLWEDIKIFFKTIVKVFEKSGINEEGMATAMDYGDYLLKEAAVTKEQYLIKQKEAIEIIQIFDK